MQDKQRKEIVDSQGNAYKSTRDSKVKQFLKDNVWNIEYSRAAEPPVQCGVSHLSRRTEPHCL